MSENHTGLRQQDPKIVGPGWRAAEKVRLAIRGNDRPTSESAAGVCPRTSKVIVAIV